MSETRARDLANLAGAGATSSTVAFHETARGFTLPAGTGEANQVISSDGDGTTTWRTTLSAPEITSATSDKGVNAYDSDGDDGAVIVVNGIALGSDSSVLTVQISTDNFVTTVQTSTVSVLSNGTQIQATFNGTETNYNTINAGETVKVKVTKSGLQSAQSVTLSGTVTGDPTFSTTSTTASTHTGTLQAESLGSYGGRIAGGGDDSNTKLLLNFDRTGGTDIEDSSNSGGDGHKITASGNATIKSSPFGDGKTAMFFDGSDDRVVVPNSADFNVGSGAWTVEYWVYPVGSSGDGGHLGIGNMSGNDSATDVKVVTIGIWSTNQFHVYLSQDGSNWGIHGGDTGGVMTRQEWNHVAVSYSGTSDGKYRFFLNGELVKTVSDTTPIYNVNQGLILGTNASSASHTNIYVDEVRFVKGSAVYTSDYNIPTSRLTAIDNTKLLIHSEIDLDSSDLNHQVTHEGNATYNTTSSKWTNRSAMYFDGTTSTAIRVPRNSIFDFGSDAFTIRGWVKPSSVSGNETIFSTTEWNGNDNADGTALMLRKSGSKWYLNATKTDYSGWEFETASSSDVTTSWQHFVVTKASGSAPVKLIIDGTTEITTSNITSIAATSGFNNKDFYIGGYAALTNQRFTGYISDFEVLRGESTTTSPINSEITKSTNTKLLLLGTTAGLFTDSATSGTTHTITPTGSYHSQNHKGIAPAMAFPASLKKTGSAGVYFDSSNSDYLTLGAETTGSILLKDNTHVGSIDFWMYAEQLGDYPLDHAGGTSYKHTSLVSKGDIVAGFKLTSDGGLLHHYWNSGHNVHCKTSANVVTANQWYHLCMAWDNNRISIFVDGVLKATSTTVTRFKVNTHTDAYGPRIGWHRTYSDGYFHGYIDNFRIVQGSLPMDTTGDPLHSSTAFSSMTSVDTTYFSKPTEIYGAFRSQDVGTIQLNATAGTGGGALDYAELSGGTALSTYGLELNQSTGAITGTLKGIADNSNSGGVIRIRARANADDNRVTTLGGSSFTGITQNDNKVPVLFNARRYAGTSANRDINGFGFQPDLVWIKTRSIGYSHKLFDSLRGPGNWLLPDTNDAENASGSRYGHLGNFLADGFSIREGVNGWDETNITGKTYISWAWKAGGVPSADGNKMVDGVEYPLASGTDYGAITGTTPFRNVRQSINTAGGFNITKFRLGTIGTSGSFNGSWFKHGLGSANDNPDFVILKNLSDTQSWMTWHSGVGAWSSANSGGYLDTNVAFTGSNLGHFFRDTTTSGMPTGDGKVWIDQRSVFAADADEDFICYTWKATDGVSAFGTYEGNSGVQTVVYANSNQFQARFILIKNIDTTANWQIFDAIRGFGGTPTGLNTPNEGRTLWPDTADAESTNYPSIQINSNGFTQNNAYTSNNVSGDTFIYMAFA